MSHPDTAQMTGFSAGNAGVKNSPATAAEPGSAFDVAHPFDIIVVLELACYLQMPGDDVHLQCC